MIIRTVVQQSSHPFQSVALCVALVCVLWGALRATRRAWWLS